MFLNLSSLTFIFLNLSLAQLYIVYYTFELIVIGALFVFRQTRISDLGFDFDVRAAGPDLRGLLAIPPEDALH